MGRVPKGCFVLGEETVLWCNCSRGRRTLYSYGRGFSDELGYFVRLVPLAIHAGFRNSLASLVSPPYRACVQLRNVKQKMKIETAEPYK